MGFSRLQRMERDAQRMNTARHGRWSAVFMRRASSADAGHRRASNIFTVKYFHDIH